MTVDDYNAMRQGLDAPPIEAIADWAEFVLPHRPPDDPAWPAPDVRKFDPDRQGTLLFRLPVRQSVICAMTAVEMVLPSWHAWAARPRGVAHAAAAPVDAPAVALNTVWRWLHGRHDRGGGNDEVAAIKPRMQQAMQRITQARQHTEAALRREPSGLTRVANYFVRAAEYVLDAAFVAYIVEAFGNEARRPEVYRKADEAVYLVISVHVQAYLSGIDAIHVPSADLLTGLDLRRSGSSDEMRDGTWAPIANAVWAHWWDRCRCRLAFCDATTAVLS